MKRVDLIYDLDCPNVGAARAALLKAFASLSLEPRWIECDRSDIDAPEEIRACGSPTIRVDGVDVAGCEDESLLRVCRVYRDESGRLSGVPPVSCIAEALRRSPATRKERTASGEHSPWTSLVALPAMGTALIPAGLCPACWPAYLGFLGSLGAGAIVESRNLFVLTALLLGASLVSLGYRAPRRRGYGPLLLGAVAVGLILTAKFAVPSEPGVLAGISMLVAASVWNAWPGRRSKRTKTPCPQCEAGASILARNAE